LLQLAGAHDAEPLARAFAALGAPFAPLNVTSERARDVYGFDLLLVRPDLHVVWRGNELPANPVELVRVTTGH
jgi:hypothetical protein